jgi:hypothetical protein
MVQLDERYNRFKTGSNGATNTPDPAIMNSAANDKPPVIEINVDTTFCSRHPKVETGLKCGRCGTPICPRCMVYTPVGIRCPDCANTPIPTVGVDSNRQETKKTPPRDTGFRTYWRNSGVRGGKVEARHYALAALAAVVVAFIGGLLWGILLNSTVRGIPASVPGAAWFDSSDGGLNALSLAVARSFIGSIHLFPEIILGLLISEAISRITGDRRGRGLQFIAMGGVLLGVYFSFVTLGARIFMNYSREFPNVLDLLGSAFGAFGQMFQGDNLSIPIFWVVAMVIVWARLGR